MPNKRKEKIIDIGKAPKKERVTDKSPRMDDKESKLEASIKEEEIVNQQLKRAADVPIVGIGASAGGLEVFEIFFSKMPADSGLAFVLVSHLDPTHKSLLVDLIKRYTKMNVMSAENDTEVQSNWVYIIPPNQDMTILNGKLLLEKLTEPRGIRHPIDHFFRSLAEEKKEKAICIVLSGAGTDGTLGVRKIKEVGGLVMVQDPRTAKYDGMPSSAINNAIIDYILPPDKMPSELIAYVQRVIAPIKPKIELTPLKTKDTLEKIFDLLRSKTGQDFKVYKKNTILRRIERRMTVCQTPQIADYYNYLEKNPQEINILFRELLIGVTNFFRDRDAFAVLKEKIIPELFKGRNPADPLKVWVIGCSTGEEAYSIAILLLEYLNQQSLDYKLQIYATDIDEAAIEKARAGLYPDSIVADVPADLLEKYFTPKENFYQVKQKVRDILVFATQNAIKDPPFSKLDILCCRNLLIYFVPDMQKKLIRLFHYALKPNGYLFLGSSEVISGFEDFFSETDRKWKFFQKKGAGINVDAKELLIFPPLIEPDKARREEILPKIEKVSYKQMIENLVLTRYSPASVIINKNNEVLYVLGKIGDFLELPQGAPNINILEMAKKEFKYELAAAIRKSFSENQMTRREKLPTSIDGIPIYVNIITLPLEPTTEELMAIVFEKIIPESIKKIEPKISEPLEKTVQARIDHLEDELLTTKHQLQTTIEELESSNEELKSTNEELQSSNEELQSTVEELQTSKEELQSMNEELLTVKNELEAKMAELTNAYDDMSNFLASTRVGTIFLDKNLCISRFTPNTREVFNFIPSDIGRPFQHIKPNFLSINLLQDVQDVLKILIPKEIEAETTDHRWYLIRITPYRTADNAVAGIVITLIDFTEQKQMKEALLRSEERYRLLIENAPEGICVFNKEGNLTFVNKRMLEILQYTKEEIMNKNIFSFLDENNTKIAKGFLEQTEKGLAKTYPLNFIRKDKTYLYTRAAISPIYDDIGAYNGLMCLVADITEVKDAEQKLLKSELFKMFFHNIQDPIFIYNLQGLILQVNPSACEMLGYSDEEFLKLEMQQLTLPKYKAIFKNLAKISQTEKIFFNLQLISRDQQIIPVELNSKRIEFEGQPAILSTVRDISHHLEFENRQRQFIYTVSHELRTPISAVVQSIGNYTQHKDQLTTDQIAKIAQIISNNSQALASMMEDIQLAENLGESTLQMKWHPYNPDQVIKGILLGIEPFREQKQIQIECHIDEKSELYGDTRLIRQIFRNLIDNAIKYSEKGASLTIRAIDHYKGEENPTGADGMLFQFIDTGIGIKESDLKFIFTRFFRTEEVMNIPGTGLGLYIARDLARMHKGDISVKSEYGKGSTFSVFLPRLKPEK